MNRPRQAQLLLVSLLVSALVVVVLLLASAVAVAEPRATGVEGDNAENYHLCGWFKARWYLSAVLISLHQFEEYVLSALVLGLPIP